MFNDPSPRQAAVRLSHLYETARHIRRLGIHDVDVETSELHVEFYDQRFHVTGRLIIEPWQHGFGWWWYADLNVPDGFIMGPLLSRRLILWCPYPRQVVRAYQDLILWERRTPRRKLHRGG